MADGGSSPGLPDLPVELIEKIIGYVDREDAKTMRITSKALECKASPFFFRSVCVPFNSKLSAMVERDLKERNGSYGKGKGKRIATDDGADDESSTNLSLPWMQKTAIDMTTYRGHGYEMFSGFGRHIRNFGMTFEVTEKDLRRPSMIPPAVLDSHDSFHGSYEWPQPICTRFDSLAALERSAEEVSHLRDAMAHLSGVKALGLSLNNGLGFLIPDAKLEAILGQTPIFGSAFPAPCWSAFPCRVATLDAIIRALAGQSLNTGDVHALLAVAALDVVRQRMGQVNGVSLSMVFHGTVANLTGSQAGGTATAPQRNARVPGNIAPRLGPNPTVRLGNRTGNGAGSAVSRALANFMRPNPRVTTPRVTIPRTMGQRLQVNVRAAASHVVRNAHSPRQHVWPPTNAGVNALASATTQILHWSQVGQRRINNDGLAGSESLDATQGQNREVDTPAMLLLDPSDLTQTQKELLVEADWAMRAFFQSYLLSVVDNKDVFQHVRSFNFAHISSQFLPMLGRADFWDAFPELEELTLLVSPDWREVGKIDSQIVESQVKPSNAIDPFFSLLHNFIGKLSGLKTLEIGWVPIFMNGDKKLLSRILPAPITLREHALSTADQPTATVHLPFIQTLKLSNCYFSHLNIKALVRESQLKSLKEVKFNNASLFAGSRPGLVLDSIRVAGAPMMATIAPGSPGGQWVPSISGCVIHQDSWAAIMNEFGPYSMLHGAETSDRPSTAHRLIDRFEFVNCGYASVESQAMLMETLETMQRWTFDVAQAMVHTSFEYRRITDDKRLMISDDALLGEMVDDWHSEEHPVLESIFRMRLQSEMMQLNRAVGVALALGRAADLTWCPGTFTRFSGVLARDRSP